MSPFTAEVAVCRAAQQAWSRLSVRDRLHPIRELRHLLVERTDDICATIAADIGRPAVEVVASELLPTAAAMKFLEQDAARLLAPRNVPRRLRPTWLFGCRDVVYRRPLGVVGIIGTWNYPLYLNAVQIAQVLTAGNGVLWKPSENAPKTAELTHRLFLDAGVPPDLFVRLPATRDAGPQLAEADVDHIVFTGSETVGRTLAARLGERLVPSTLELSGCDALFVLEDANLEMAAKAAWFGVTLNRGQTCIAVRRIFVQQPRYAEFAEALRPMIERAKPLPLVTEAQKAQAEQLIRDAQFREANLLPSPLEGEGGSRSEPGEGLRAHTHPSPAPPAVRDELPSPSRGEGEKTGREAASGFAVRPTFLFDATPDMAICREASFAPIAAVMPFDTLDEALSLATRCPFALAASIFTNDVGVAEQLAARLPVKSVVVNDALAPTAHPATPFGGRGASGWGVTQGAEGLLAMTAPQTVAVRQGKYRPHLDEAVSPDPATLDVLRGLLRATHGRDWREWWRGVKQLFKGILRKR